MDIITDLGFTKNTTLTNLKKNTTNKENPDELLLFHGFPSQSISHCSSATQGNLIIFHHLKVSKEPNFNQNL